MIVSGPGFWTVYLTRPSYTYPAPLFGGLVGFAFVLTPTGQHSPYFDTLFRVAPAVTTGQPLFRAVISVGSSVANIGLYTQAGPQRVAYRGAEEQVFVVLVREASGRISPLEGIAAGDVTVRLAKAATSTWIEPNDGTWTEVGSGVYTLQLDSTDKNTLGPMIVRARGGSPATYETQAMLWVAITDEEEAAEYTRIRTLHRELL